jgi:hypothetical protein
MLRRLGWGLALGAGMAGAAAAQTAADFDGRYVGELTLTKTIDGDCTPPPVGATYPLTIAGGRVSFAYVPHFDAILTGRIDRTGAFTASAPLKHGSVRMTGQVRGVRLTATIVSPSCIYAFRAQD